MEKVPLRRHLLAVGLFAPLLGWPILFSAEGYTCRVLGMALLYGTLALSWNVLALTGTISLGHAAFFGLGSYASALISLHGGVSPYLGVLFGAFLAGGCGVFLHALFGNLRGAAYALATLAFVEIPKVLADNWESVTGGSLGLIGIPAFPGFSVGGVKVDAGGSLQAQYFLLLILAMVVGFIHSKAIHSHWGWAIRAVREEPVAASVLGVDLQKTKLAAFSLSAFLTGLCGGIYAHLMGLIEPPLVFSLHISALPLVFSIFGGRFESFGPLLAALILYPLDQLYFHRWLPVGHAVLYGLVVIVAVIFFPHGIGEWIRQKLKVS